MFNPTHPTIVKSYYDSKEDILITGGWDGSIEIF